MQTARELLRATLESRLQGRYLIGEELGFGGMAVVYRAENLELGRPVALKVLRPDKILDPETALRFRTEALAIARLAHPHIVAIHARGEDPDLMWFEVDFVDGGTLADLFSNDKMEWPRFLRLVAQAASALAYAHSMGVVHRDIKPSNLMLMASHDHLIVTDFGIAKILGRTTMTETGMTLGTVAYMSPEQLMAQDVTGATDQYSLGIVLYEGLAGHTPFSAEHSGPATLERLRDSIPSLRDIRPELPEELDLLVRRMLAPNPSDRWVDLKAVQRIAEELAITGHSRHVYSTGAIRRGWRRRRSALIGGAVLVGAIGFGAVELRLQAGAAPNDEGAQQSPTASDDDSIRVPTDSAMPVEHESPGSTAATKDTLGQQPVPRAGPSVERPRTVGAPDREAAKQEEVPSNVATDSAPPPVVSTTGTLQIASRLPGTFLYVNGSATPHVLTEQFQNITVPAGSVTLILRSNQPGCSTREDRLTIRPGEVRKLQRTANCPDE